MTERAEAKSSAWYAATVLLGSSFLLFCNLFTFRAVPFLLDGDQVYFWTYGLRLLHGDRMYQDFFAIRPPGAALVYAGLFGAFGERIWVTNAAVLVLGVALCWICFRIARRLMEPQPALLATALFLVLVYNKMLNGTHHWFSLLAVMGAVAILARDDRIWRVALAGSLLGVAAFFTQTRGPFALLGFAAFLLWDWQRKKERWPELLRRQGMLLACFAGALTIVSSYFLATSGGRTLWYFQITYVRQHLTGAAFLGLPEAVTWRRLPFLAQYLWAYLLLPVVYALSFYRCRREQSNEEAANWRMATLLMLVGASLMLEVGFSVNWLRVFAVTMPAIVLLLWLMAAAKGSYRVVVAALWIPVVGLAVAQTWSRHARTAIVGEWPGGRATIRPKEFEELGWLARRTKPGDFFFQAGWTSFYLPLQVQNPLFVDVLESTAVTSPGDVALTVSQIKEVKVRYVLWPPRLNAPDSFYGPEQYHLEAFRDYLHSHYRLVASFSDGDEAWERKEK
jgi:dolichyl-phosphate-mannose-protein mannosyltransferase